MPNYSDIACDWLPAGDGDAEPGASSCGLDFWHSAAGLRWACSYLHATNATLRVGSGNVQARLRCLMRRFPGGLQLASAYPYGYIDGDVELFWQAIPVIAAALRRKRILRIEIPFTGPYQSQLHAVSVPHVVARPSPLNAVRHVIDLTGLDHATIDQRFHPNARWAVRKAKRNGCTVREATLDEADVLQDLYAKTMRAKRAPVNYGVERWIGIASQFAPQGHGHLYVGELEGRPRGMAAMVDGVCSRHLIQLAVPPDAHATRLGELLVSTAIHDAKEKGLRYFDFMASAAADEGLIAFKGKWGTAAEPIEYAVIPGFRGLHRIVDAARWAHQAAARVHGA